MSEATTRPGKNDPVAWFRLAIFQRTIHGNALRVQLSEFGSHSKK